MNHSPKNVEQIYSDIWFPDLLDSLKCDSSLFSIRLNCNEQKNCWKKSDILRCLLCLNGLWWNQYNKYATTNVFEANELKSVDENGIPWVMPCQKHCDVFESFPIDLSTNPVHPLFPLLNAHMIHRQVLLVLLAAFQLAVLICAKCCLLLVRFVTFIKMDFR